MVEDDAFGGASNLQTKEELKVSNILDAELRMEMLFDSSDFKEVIASEDNIININQ